MKKDTEWDRSSPFYRKTVLDFIEEETEETEEEVKNELD